jgi:uncharacterized flavoprotein (TIGR03862 family)
MPAVPHIAIVGGGPAGLRAAEVALAGGARVSLHEAKRSVGRKLLVAGYGGLNLTHGEPLDAFVSRYAGPGLPTARFGEILRAFPPAALRRWAADLGIETFEQRTGRVYPREMKAAPLLRRWLERLRRQGLVVHVNRRLGALEVTADGPLLEFDPDLRVRADAVILALGGASWPRTGSDGGWTRALTGRGVAVTPFAPANCGWEVGWPEALARELEGRPLKNLAVTADDLTVLGELLLTRYGLEGGAIYQLGRTLRAMDPPRIEIDFKPEVPAAALARKMESVRRDFTAAAATRLKLTEPALRLLDHFAGPFDGVEPLVAAVKSLPVPLGGPRPIAEAISSAGGIAWSELDAELMLTKLPGIFAAGEMIDWEAPTGGYLIQACFATATRAALGARKWIGSGGG